MTETFINKSTLQENYSTLPNKLINDEKLSGDGLAVLVYLLSKPADWKVNAQNIANRFGCGINKVYQIIKQLIQYGYVKKDVIRDQGRYTQIVYYVYDQPFHCLPQMVLPEMDISETYKVKKGLNKESTNDREPTIWDIAVPRLVQLEIEEKKARGVIMMLLKSLKTVKDVAEKEKIVLDTIFKMPDNITQYDRVLPYLTAMVKKSDVVTEPVKVFTALTKQLTVDEVVTAKPFYQNIINRDGDKTRQVLTMIQNNQIHREQIGWFHGT
tara:strand:- start:1115 stop:1921 length:807 start_codon:yes stop_codon:yes gene_type:complete